MRKKIMLGLATMILSFLPIKLCMANSFQNGNYYLKYLGGTNFIKDVESKKMGSAAVALGYEIEIDDDLKPYIETEVSYRNNIRPADQYDAMGSVSTLCCTFNLGASYQIYENLYVLGDLGLGYAEHDRKYHGLSFPEKFLSYHVKGGLSYVIHENYHLGFDYKYLGLKNGLNNHSVYFSVKQYL